MTEQARQFSPAQVRANRIKLLVLWLVPFGLMAIAGIVFYLVQTGQMSLGSKNNGVLMRPPLQLQENFRTLSLLDEKGKAQVVEGSPWQGKWSIVVPAFERCDESCRDALYLTRQLHIRLDKNANRVQRVLLAGPAAQQQLGSAAFNQYVDSEHRLLKRIVYSNEANEAGALLRDALSSDSGQSARFFLVDPEGWAMMYYLVEHEGNAILADLKHLLKFSRQR